MIASSRLVKIGAGLLAICAHGAFGLAVVSAPPPVRMEGQTGALDARLGTSFADMVAGSLSPQAPTDTALKPLTPAATEPMTAEPPETAALTPVEASLPPEHAKMPTAPAVVPHAHPTVTPVSAQEVAPEPAPRHDSAAPSSKITPVTRPAPPESPAKPAEKNRPKPKAAPPPAGNAETTARAGQVTGHAAAKASSTGSGGAKKTTGNAAVSNYPGQVMRRLSRVSRPRVSARGAALVSFRLASSGALAGLSIARSSGSAELDRAALDVVQRAAPFPPPPAGARRAFSVEIKGR
ncbi:energy transducer TonB family protein [Celeribacter neptunius]|uniref:Outer membrane transport energization protein TonB n=1 Tax=Celeribacter neptunius TaxID=588602 RepID=A0A1I3TJ15_9RHOB|nr:TonB family protein [Celeribacter neptunius]SFJ69606.1 outer membrane transport energization protein TonB [Celeribacter neptunius]